MFASGGGLVLVWISCKFLTEAKKLMVCNGDCLRYMPYKWRNDKRIVATALQWDGSRLRWASARLRDDLEIVMMAVDHDATGSCLRFASLRLRGCAPLGLHAVEANGAAILHLDPVFLRDADIVGRASLTFPALPLADFALRTDLALVDSVWRNCEQTIIGPNLSFLPFLEDDLFLEQVAKTIGEDDVFLCRVRLLSGKAVLTSFPATIWAGIDWRRDCLGLSRLFSVVRESPVHGQVLCKDTSSDFRAWAILHGGPDLGRLGLDIGVLNDVVLVLRDAE